MAILKKIKIKKIFEMFFYLDRDFFQAYLHKKSFGLVLGLGFQNFWVFGFEFWFGYLGLSLGLGI
jgi:hypothetical protein